MSTSLSSLADNLSEEIFSDKRKDFKSVLDYMSVKHMNFCNGNINKFILLLKGSLSL